MHDDQLDLVLKAIAHAERRRILASLQERPNQSLFEICTASYAHDGLTRSRQTISQHLNTLERAGLVHVTWQGRTKMHTINPTPLQAALEAVANPFLRRDSR